MNRWLSVVVAVAVIALSGCGTTIPQAVEPDSGVSSLNRSTVNAAIANLRVKITNLEYADARRYLAALENGKHVSRHPHLAEIKRLRGYITKARGEEPYPQSPREKREAKELDEAMEH